MIDPILKDRMYVINTKGFKPNDKIMICNYYILPELMDTFLFDQKDIVFTDESLLYIIEKHTSKEEGVRNLKRCLEVIHTKLNLYRLMKPDTNLFEEDMSIKVEFPFIVTTEIVDKLIKSGEKNTVPFGMYL